MSKGLMYTCVVVFVAVVLVGVTAAQAYFKPQTEPGSGVLGFRDGSTFFWGDDFLDFSMIDPLLSHDYLLNISGSGTISMKNTFSAWKNPMWDRVKTFDVSNQGGESVVDLILDVTVYYDADMQPDFDDIRFADEQGNFLTYFISEKVNGDYAKVFVQIPEILAGETLHYFLFYGNHVVSDASSDEIFELNEVTIEEDVRVSYVFSEGAWDPDTAFGNNKFFVAWEEGIGPTTSRVVPRQIHGRTYDVDGANPNPDPVVDDIIISVNLNNYHAENPSVAYGGGKFFIVWEENSVILPNQVDIKGAFVSSNGGIYNRITICDVTSGQFDPEVAYDAESNRFMVVWEDARAGSTNYNVYGKLFTTSGSQVGSEILVDVASSNQAQPEICSDSNGNFLVVYEQGSNAETGPFSVYGCRFDQNGNKLGSRFSIASGSSSTDYIFPAATFNAETSRYCVVFNDGDVSQNPDARYAYDGNIWGKILDETGATVTSNFIIQSGYDYMKADVLPYFESMFFVAYDDTDHIWGRLMSSDGQFISDRQGLCDDINQDVDWVDLTAGLGNIFAVWEDERILDSLTDVYGSVWQLSFATGGSDVVYDVGSESSLVLETVVTSLPVMPDEFREWYEFFSDYQLTPNSDCVFDIINETGQTVLFSDVSSGNDISSVLEPVIRLRATFTRSTPEDTPLLDSWNVTGLVGTDIEPPWTDIFLNPATPNEHGWYNQSITITFEAHDNISISENITTYYKINDGSLMLYDAENNPVISTEGPDNKIEFWSVDEKENEELPHNLVEDINIDRTYPYTKIDEPQPGLIDAGSVQVVGYIVESESGSGIQEIELFFNGGEVPPEQITFENQSFMWNFSAKDGQHYDIHVKSYDFAGNIGQDRIELSCDESYGMIEIGYLYLFGDKIRLPLFETLELAVVVDDEDLLLRLKQVEDNASKVKFVARRIYGENEYVSWDDDLSDGCLVSFYVPFGLYEIKAQVFDAEDQLLGEHMVVSKVLTLLF